MDKAHKGMLKTKTLATSKEKYITELIVRNNHNDEDPGINDILQSLSKNPTIKAL